MESNDITVNLEKLTHLKIKQSITQTYKKVKAKKKKSILEVKIIYA